MVMESISGHFIILSSLPGSDGKTPETIARSLYVLAISEFAVFHGSILHLSGSHDSTASSHFFCHRLSEEMDPKVLDAIADFMNANKVSYKWKKVIKLQVTALSFILHLPPTVTVLFPAFFIAG